jgi:hypothetical protein
MGKHIDTVSLILPLFIFLSNTPSPHFQPHLCFIPPLFLCLSLPPLAFALHRCFHLYRHFVLLSHSSGTFHRISISGLMELSDLFYTGQQALGFYSIYHRTDHIISPAHIVQYTECEAFCQVARIGPPPLIRNRVLPPSLWV